MEKLCLERVSVGIVLGSVIKITPLTPWSLMLWVDALQEVKTAIKKIKQVDEGTGRKRLWKGWVREASLRNDTC